MASQVPKSILTHSQRVCRLYKAAVRTMQYQYDHRNFFLVERVVLRHRFDETNKEKDFRKLAAMLEEGEHEVWKNQHSQPFYFKVSITPVYYHQITWCALSIFLVQNIYFHFQVQKPQSQVNFNGENKPDLIRPLIKLTLEFPPFPDLL